MLTLLSSSRALLDRWRAGRGSLPPAHPISGAIPGVGPAVAALGGMLARRPTPFLLVIGVVTLLLGVASTRIVTVFNTNDFLPSGGEAIRHIETLDAAFGGSTGTVKVLIETEITNNRAIRNIIDFSEAFSRTTCAGPREWSATSSRPSASCWSTGSPTTARQATTTTPSCAR